VSSFPFILEDCQLPLLLQFLSLVVKSQNALYITRASHRTAIADALTLRPAAGEDRATFPTKLHCPFGVIKFTL
jgi:hypothetical protein